MDWGAVFVKLSFWYGFSYHDVKEMPNSALQLYMSKLPALKAELSLLLIEAVTIQNRKKHDITRALREIEKTYEDGFGVARKAKVPTKSILGKLRIKLVNVRKTEGNSDTGE